MNTVLRIADIETKEILFYDAEFEEKCFNFCKQRDIEFLPSLDNPSETYVRDDIADGFKLETINQERKIDGTQNAFHSMVLDTFHKNHLLFVYSTNNELSGVVHFSDFNKSIVNTYLFQLLFQYERLLRTFLQEYGFNNSDMVKYFESKVTQAKKRSKDFYQRKINNYLKEQAEIDKLPPFQSFYLDDLISFTNAQGNNLSVDVIQVRNTIMHAHELVNMQNWNADDYIFDFASFEKFYTSALTLHRDYKNVKNKVAFLQGIDGTVSFG